MSFDSACSNRRLRERDWDRTCGGVVAVAVEVGTDLCVFADAGCVAVGLQPGLCSLPQALLLCWLVDAPDFEDVLGRLEVATG